MAAKRPDFPTLLRVYVAAEDHERLDRFGDERRCLLRVREGVRPRSGGGCIPRAGRIHLRLDDARIAVVNGSQHGHGATVLPRVADEELALLSRCAHPLVTEVSPTAALCAACATVSLSTKPSNRKVIFAGRV